MAKIPKNRQDNEMFGNQPEITTFEHLRDSEPTPQPAPKPVKATPAETAYSAYLTPALQEELGKQLLTLKVNLYKKGVVDYTLKATCEGDQIILKAIPKPPKPETPQHRR